MSLQSFSFQTEFWNKKSWPLFLKNRELQNLRKIVCFLAHARVRDLTIHKTVSHIQQIYPCRQLIFTSTAKTTLKLFTIIHYYIQLQSPFNLDDGCRGPLQVFRIIHGYINSQPSFVLHSECRRYIGISQSESF